MSGEGGCPLDNGPKLAVGQPNNSQKKYWRKLESAVSANIKKPQFSVSFMNWKKLKYPARSMFKSPNFQSAYESGKTWKYSLRPRFKRPNLSFTGDYEMGSLHKIGHISNVT